jgi:hypothetical protein
MYFHFPYGDIEIGEGRGLDKGLLESVKNRVNSLTGAA